MISWQWLGQPCEDWPRWLWFRNWARDGDRLVLPQLEGVVVMNLGDWVDRRPDGFLTLRP
jgi:hypothetical protein